MKGFCILNKPKGITSFDAIKKTKIILKQKENILEKRVGHAGTLDPFADGVLILAFGRYTKLFFLFDDLNKEYIASGVFGESRDTDDIEGNTIKVSNNINKLSFEELENIIKTNFKGNIIQKPPIYSAKKINGKRAYDLARDNKSFELKDINVFIEKIELLEYDYPYFKIKTSVSKGTYIRSIIRDIGEITGNFAYTKELKRVSIGNYNIDMSCNIEDISKNKILSFFDMFKNFDKTIIENTSDIKQILCGNTKTIENIKINNKYMALTDNKNNLLAIIEKNNTDKNNKYAFIDIE
ncbi:pseudouridylate synthase [Brachyspira hampsonii 30446]|uniref:tRNA pseudouridine synthase B n=1 Tax=Brachyspira hampsonii 30446 TaxID=1289135 RepID=A0A2U4F0D1_9SPIR|nr:tRNA pseudouridine(55) synthase TruB [Brachyspira hampsonii]EKV56419.1 pseudouridylate synthase [Brachyspira hampsonii 30446]MBW5393440.1 tRNA pseudouridine(55) synthase TruB [Brachyspira hampsonii]OEJ19864.1 tRNA pseudouridine(55) synthase TruB [Brachyspira hampsonii]